MLIKISDEDSPQEIEETLNEKAGISVQRIDNSENVSTMIENYLPDMETNTLEYFIASIAPSLDASHNTPPNMPHPVGKSIAEVPSPARRNLTNFWDDDAQDNGYDSDGELGPFYYVLEEEDD